MAVKINPEKIEELKKKHNLTDEAIFEVLDLGDQGSDQASDQDEEESPLAPQRRPQASQPSVLGQLNRGEISFAEAILYIDMMDRREDRRLRRDGGGQTDITKVLESLETRWKSQSKEDRDYFEKLLLTEGKKSAEEKAAEAQAEIRRRDEAEEKRRLVAEGASEAEQRMSKELDKRLGSLPPKAQNDFWGELLDEFQGDLREGIKQEFIKRIKGEPTVPTIRTEGGEIKIDYGNLANRAFGLMEKFIETWDKQQKPPAKRPIKELPEEPIKETPPIERKIPIIPLEPSREPVGEPAMLETTPPTYTPAKPSSTNPAVVTTPPETVSGEVAALPEKATPKPRAKKQ